MYVWNARASDRPSASPHFVAARHAEAVVRLEPGAADPASTSPAPKSPAGPTSPWSTPPHRPASGSSRRHRPSAGRWPEPPCVSPRRCPLPVRNVNVTSPAWVGVTDQDVGVEERAGRALGVEPGRRRLRTPADSWPPSKRRGAEVHRPLGDDRRGRHDDRERLVDELGNAARHHVDPRRRRHVNPHDGRRRPPAGTSPSPWPSPSPGWPAARTCRRTPATLPRTATRAGASTALPPCPP